jgi:Na+/alanine symporter
MIVIGAALSLENVVPLMDSLIFLMPITNVLALLLYSN